MFLSVRVHASSVNPAECRDRLRVLLKGLWPSMSFLVTLGATSPESS